MHEEEGENVVQREGVEANAALKNFRILSRALSLIYERSSRIRANICSSRSTNGCIWRKWEEGEKRKTYVRLKRERKGMGIGVRIEEKERASIVHNFFENRSSYVHRYFPPPLSLVALYSPISFPSLSFYFCCFWDARSIHRPCISNSERLFEADRPESSRKHYWRVFIRERRRRRETQYLEVVLTRAAGRYKPLQLASSFSPSTSFAFSSRLPAFSPPPPPPRLPFHSTLTHDRRRAPVERTRHSPSPSLSLPRHREYLLVECADSNRVLFVVGSRNETDVFDRDDQR